VTTVKKTVINFRNTFYIEYCKKTFLNSNFCNFCNFWVQFDSFDVSDSCHVVLEHCLARKSRDNCQKNCHKSQKHVFYRILQENVCKLIFAKFWAQFDSFDVNDSCHVVLEPYLARQSRDNCQNNCHKSQKRVFSRILQENFSKLWFLHLLSTVWQFWR